MRRLCGPWRGVNCEVLSINRRGSRGCGCAAPCPEGAGGVHGCSLQPDLEGVDRVENALQDWHASVSVHFSGNLSQRGKSQDPA